MPSSFFSAPGPRASCFGESESKLNGERCREAEGAFFQPSSLEALLGNVSAVKMQQAAQQTNDLLATVLAGDAPK